MKKWIAIALAAVLLILPLTGCSGTDADDTQNPGNVSGVELAKLLLAHERLNAHLLKTEGDLLESGAATLQNLATTAHNNLLAIKPQALTPPHQTPVTASPTAISGFPEICNAYEYFKNLTERITQTAQSGANLIDFVKTNVRVVDMWVEGVIQSSQSRAFLHVEENAELILQEIPEDPSYRYVCRRYKNEKGQDVYELFEGNDIETCRATYIAGEHYELTVENGGRYDCFVADNSKGYWETMFLIRSEDWGEDMHNLSFLTIKDNICYKGTYNPRTGEMYTLDVMSSDKKADILQVDENAPEHALYTIKFAGFDGIASFDGFGDTAVLTLTNGKKIALMDTYDNGVEVRGINAGASAYGNEGEITIYVPGATRAEQRAKLKAQLAAWGLVCRRNFDGVMAGVDTAYKELAVSTQYHRWNGYATKTAESVEAGFAVELERIAAITALYTDNKDKPTVDLDDAQAVELAAHFAKPTASFGDISYANGQITVTGVTLTLNDTFLFVKEQPYMVAFGLQSTDGLVHLTAETQTVAFAGGDTITVQADNITLDVPMLAENTYTPVAYIATADGIRSSACVPLTFTAVDATAMQVGNINLTAAKEKDNTMKLTFAQTDDVYLTYGELPVDYAALRALFEEVAAPYGVPVETAVEMLGADGAYTAMSGSETAIAVATYRLGYTTVNGNKTRTGYIYLSPQ